MSYLSNAIENYILKLFNQHQSNTVEIQRNEMASEFRCAPSQINYVIATRFTMERGYYVESKRGGGGYIKITKINLTDKHLKDLLIDKEYLSQSEAQDILLRLKKEGYINNKELEIFNCIVKREVLPLNLPIRDKIRANIIRSIVNALIKINHGGES